MAKAVLVMDMQESCHRTHLQRNGMINVRSVSCRRKQIILIIVIMEDLIKVGMPAWRR